ncbi:hypothetical protein CW700_00665 [Candidatus Bathyarchaeota archaeon]|nr:MAG: hypothetical protein CW700_00665 [Candidatus Bathyarchaeota archaeon]
MDSVKVSGFIVLFIGVGVLLFTFYSAYTFLIGVLEIPSSGSLIDLFGEALAPLIVYAIRALYLGIMGWIGSILTRRGVQTVTARREEAGVRIVERGEVKAREVPKPEGGADVKGKKLDIKIKE